MSKNNICDEEYKEALYKLSEQMQKSRIGDYIDLMSKPVRLITINFLSGIARGFGIAIGFTILGAIVLYFLQRIVMLNLPIIGGFVTEIVKLVKLNVR